VRLVDLVTAGETIRPNIAVLIERRVSRAADQDQIFDLRGRFEKSRRLIRMIADEFRTEQNKRPLLSRVRLGINKSRRDREPRSRSQIVLIIDRYPFEQCACRKKKSVVVRIVNLPLVVVAKNEFVVPPIAYAKIEMRPNQPFLCQQIVERARRGDHIRTSG